MVRIKIVFFVNLGFGFIASFMSTCNSFNTIPWVRFFTIYSYLFILPWLICLFGFVTGALCAICDVNEYRKCVQEFKIPMITTLFDTLHALCNLLLVMPENLEQVCTGDPLVRFTGRSRLYLSAKFRFVV